MKNNQNIPSARTSLRKLRNVIGWLGAMTTLACQPLLGASALIYSENFDGFAGAATSLEDVSDADIVHTNMVMQDDTPIGSADGTGVQLVNWQAHSAPNALLVRSGSEARVHLFEARSGTKYQLDFWLYVVKGAGNRNFYIILRGAGSDINAGDYVAYRSDRAATANIFYFDGIVDNGWFNSGASHVEGTWQHHRMVVDTAGQKMDLYLDDMTTPVLAGVDLARGEVPVPTMLRLLNEGDSADDGYFIIDDISLTVEGSTDLSMTFKDGFESYPVAVNAEDDADPQGPWVTVEMDGTGAGKPVVPTKVQVVNATVVPAHSGSQCLKLEGGQRAGATIAWGVPPQSDVQITWWARVPASVAGATANYLRMSLYGAENGSLYDTGDDALLGYGSRQAGLGDETSLTYYVGSGWADSGVDYTPDTWEEYRLTTHTAAGQYTIIKNPSSANPQVVVDRMPMIGTASTWAPVIMAAWSSSNGSGHPPVYIDDIEVKSLVSIVAPLGSYTVHLDGDRFTNVTTIVVTNLPVGSVAVDPRDSKTILFSTDVAGGSIYRANKVSTGNWSIDPSPLATGLDRPSGLTVALDGTIWWTHDYAGSVVRLKEPWATSTPEVVIAGFGAATDDDPIDLTVAPTNFDGTLGKPNMIVVADRGADGDTLNAVYLIDPATTELNQTGYANFLLNPTTDLSAQNLNAITALPQTGEVVTLSTDGFIVAINGDGILRNIRPATLWVNPPAPSAIAIAGDPATGRVWVADDTLDQIWSVTADGSDRQEVSFPLDDPLRPDRQINFHDPGMVFAPDGSFLVVVDGSTSNGGGRLHILHNDAAGPAPFSILPVTRSDVGVQLKWQSAGPVKYRVQRSTDLGSAAGFQEISGDLTATEFTDPAPPAGTAFYRVRVLP